MILLHIRTKVIERELIVVDQYRNGFTAVLYLVKSFVGKQFVDVVPVPIKY
jgi:hypothetical protein